ncbi:hypothetical protein DHX103_05770 [Planococcus sp. X10-3]|uniref:hypothetical protein n=1 Tax=Planococcus sp. X10-3 TaxID=3061240 RepID=UPI003BB092DD
MIFHIIIGNNIDTKMWIDHLVSVNAENIVVLDFDYDGKPKYIKDVTFLSPIDIKNHYNEFDSFFFYKSLYAYPGMSGKMSSLFKDKNIE